MAGIPSSLSIGGFTSWTGSGAFTRSLGPASIFEVEGTLQNSPVKLLTDIVLRQGSNTVKFRDCALTDPLYQNPAYGSSRVILRYKDRRWRWEAGGGTVSGQYNLRDADGKVVKKTEKKPVDLLKECFKELRESNVSMSAVPNELRPSINWDATPTFIALMELLGQLGCSVALGLDDRVRVVRIGAGKSLPSGGVQAEGAGVQQLIAPEEIELVGGPISYQGYLHLGEAVGQEVDPKSKDDLWRSIDKLTYAPEFGPGPWEGEKGWPSAYLPSVSLTQDFPNLKPKEIKELQALAEQYVYRAYRITGFGDRTLKVPGREDAKPITADRIVPHDYLHERDPRRPMERMQPKVFGEFVDETNVGMISNILAPYQGSFSIDADSRVVQFPDRLYMMSLPKVLTVATSETGPKRPIQRCVQANLYLYTSYHILDENRAPERYRRKRTLRKGNKSGVATIRQEDVTLEINAVEEPDGPNLNRNGTGLFGIPDFFKSKGDRWKVTKTKDNSKEVEKEADHYLDYEAFRLKPDDSADRTYDSLRADIEVDGRIQQVSYLFRNFTVTTQASLNTEHSIVVPPYADRVEKSVKKKKYKLS